MTKFAIGQPIRRLEDEPLVQGKGRYSDDVRHAGETHAYVLRSPHAHALIRGIDTVAAQKAPGVLLVLTGADVIKDKLGDIP
jgi:carbon-monoxide dehydrogenase large subunit